MNDIDAYLERYYRTTEQLAAACSIGASDLAELVNERLVPAPSYSISSQGTLLSKAFGEFPDCGAKPGDYYHPANATWVALAVEAKQRLEPEAAHRELQERFRRNFALALKECNRGIFRLPDSFTDAGHPITDGIEVRTAEAWDAFLDGIYSLCVADPSTEMSIARKEVLQEALNQLSTHGSADACSTGERARILDLIDQYEQAAMPFSPLEYPRSSRKRLAADFRAALGPS